MAATTTASCGLFGDDDGSSEAKTAASRNRSRPTLRIAQVQHFVPGYDTWFDSEYVVGWGERNDIEVVVDHIPLAELVSRASAETAAQRGHDLFAFPSPPSAFEDDVVDHRDLVEEVQGKLGALTPLVERCVHNPKTGKWFGFPDYWSPNLVHYRADLWADEGMPAELAALLAKDTVARPPEKYALLSGATEWSVNLGHPGPANAAMDEVINLYLVPEMFARAARGEASPEESVRATTAKVEPIFAKWRDRGKI